MSTEANKELVRRYQEAHNTNNLEALSAIVAEDLIAHRRPDRPGGQSRCPYDLPRDTYRRPIGDGQRTQVGPDPLDYVLRYAACDYDCYHQGRYIGSRATLPKAIEAVEYEQAKPRPVKRIQTQRPS
jgi:hypothetical protein